MRPRPAPLFANMSSPINGADCEIHLSVVIPIYNEEAILSDMAEQLAPHLDEIAGAGRWQFVLVDNGSTDRSAVICGVIVGRRPGSMNVRLARQDYGGAIYQRVIGVNAPSALVFDVA